MSEKGDGARMLTVTVMNRGVTAAAAARLRRGEREIVLIACQTYTRDSEQVCSAVQLGPYRAYANRMCPYAKLSVSLTGALVSGEVERRRTRD